MKKDFEIGQSNEVIKSEKIYDLHNSYDYVGLILKSKERQLQILFEPNSEYGKGNLSVSFVFKSLNYLEFSPNFGTKVVSGLDEMGYKSPSDRDDNWLLSPQQASSDDHLFFRLENGDFIRVHSKHAFVVEATNVISIVPIQGDKRE